MHWPVSHLQLALPKQSPAATADAAATHQLLSLVFYTGSSSQHLATTSNCPKTFFVVTL
jgi:hypothetical protein